MKIPLFIELYTFLLPGKRLNRDRSTKPFFYVPLDCFYLHYLPLLNEKN